MDAIPGTSPGQQHLQALGRANEVRLARAELKRRIATGEASAAEVIMECPWEARSMAVADLLMTQRRWGSSRCRRLLAQVPVSETKEVGALTERQRVALVALLAPGDGVAEAATRDRAPALAV